MINVIPNSSYQKLKLEKASVHESVNRAKVKAQSCSLVPTLWNVNIFAFQESLGMRLTIMHLLTTCVCLLVRRWDLETRLIITSGFEC